MSETVSIGDAAPGVLLLDDTGRLIAATAPATHLLDLLADAPKLPAVLRSLHARALLADDGLPVVAGLPARPRGRLLLHAARANRRVTVVVQARIGSERSSQLGRLTRREREVLDLVVQGLATKHIAGALSISPWTVTDHIGSLLAKTGVSRRTELIALMLERDGLAG